MCKFDIFPDKKVKGPQQQQPWNFPRISENSLKSKRRESWGPSPGLTPHLVSQQGRQSSRSSLFCLLRVVHGACYKIPALTVPISLCCRHVPRNCAFCFLGQTPLCDSVSKASAQTIEEKMILTLVKDSKELSSRTTAQGFAVGGKWGSNPNMTATGV